MTDGGGIFGWPTPFFESRAIFKVRITQQNPGEDGTFRFRIPESEVEILNISKGNRVFVQVYDPNRDIKIEFTKTVNAQNNIIVPKRLLPDIGLSTYTTSQIYLRRTGPRISFDFDPDPEIFNRFIIYKGQPRSEKNPEVPRPSSLEIGIRFNEIRDKNVSKGDMLNVAIIKLESNTTGFRKALEFAPTRNRSIFRAQVLEARRFSFTIPAVRRRLKGIDLDDTLQVIATKARVG